MIKFIKNIEILSSNYKIKWDKTHNGGAFSCANSTITVGIKCYDTDPLYTLNILNHELFEVILVELGGRFTNSRTADNYLFNFDHQTFETAVKIYTQTINKFLIK